jgi:hypothetical protein
MISNSVVKRAGEVFERGNNALAAEDGQRVIDTLHREIGNCIVVSIIASAAQADDAGGHFHGA